MKAAWASDKHIAKKARCSDVRAFSVCSADSVVKAIGPAIRSPDRAILRDGKSIVRATKFVQPRQAVHVNLTHLSGRMPITLQVDWRRVEFEEPGALNRLSTSSRC
jgi:hypothetical protein